MGPVSYETLLAFWPGETLHTRLHALASFYLRQPLTLTLRVSVPKSELARQRLGRLSAACWDAPPPWESRRRTQWCWSFPIAKTADVRSPLRKGIVMFLVEYRALEATKPALYQSTGSRRESGNFPFALRNWRRTFSGQNSGGASGDANAIFRALSVSGTPLLRAIHRGSDQRKRGNSGRPVFSPILVSLIQDAWLLSSVEGGDNKIRSGYLFIDAFAPAGTLWCGRSMQSCFL